VTGTRALRLFVAFVPSAGVRDRLLDELGALPDLPKGRWIENEAWHLTLQFLGRVEAGMVDRVRLACAFAAGRVKPFDTFARAHLLLFRGKAAAGDLSASAWLAELLLFFASRSLNIHNTILPALDAGEWVICDRFTDATRAYQGSGRCLDRTRIETLAEWVHNGLQPDLTILLDAPPGVGRTRAEQRSAADRMESEQDDFHARVRMGYLQLARDEPGRFAVIDANRDIGQVQADIKAAVEPLFSAGAGS